MVSWFATIAFCLFSLCKPVACNVTLNEDELPQLNLESTKRRVSAEPKNGVQYFLSTKKHHYARVKPNFPGGGANIGIYKGPYYLDQLWELETDEEFPDYYYIRNVHHSHCRMSCKKRGNIQYLNCGRKSHVDLFKFVKTGDAYLIIGKVSHGKKLATSSDRPVYLHNGAADWNNEKFILTPRFDVRAVEKVIWSHDNRGGSAPFPSKTITEETGVSVTNSKSFEVGLSVTTTLEVGAEGAYAGIGLSASASTSMTADMRASMSSSVTKDWKHTETWGPYSAPAGKYFEIITYQLDGKGKLHGGGRSPESFKFTPERTCTIECSGFQNCPPEKHKCSFSSDTDGIVYKGFNQTAEDETNKIL